MFSELRFYVAYDRGENDHPNYLPVLPAPEFDPRTDSEDLANWLELMETEGGIAAKVTYGSTLIAERTYPPDPDAPRIYMVTHPAVTEFHYSTTFSQLCSMIGYRNDVFREIGNGIMALTESGPMCVAIDIRDYRRRMAEVDGPGVPVCKPGDFIPHDGTYIQITTYRSIYRRSTPTSRFHAAPCARDVIPYVDYRPLWAAPAIDMFMAFGLERAIDAAQDAVEIARSGREYDVAAHVERYSVDLSSRVGEALAMYHANRKLEIGDRTRQAAPLEG